MMKGVVDPINDQENKVSAFLRLAGEIIPLLDVEADGDNSATRELTYVRQQCFGSPGDVIYTCVNLSGSFWVGWWARQNGVTGVYNVTYTPFALA
jgi:hypothetical protein